MYRLSLDGGMTCPNRDGTYSLQGCSFCSAGGSGDFAASRNVSITEQLTQAKERIRSKTDCRKFIAYFQAYTNTYADVDYLRRIYYEAIAAPDVVALSIGTRSDCLSPDILDLLEEINAIKPVWIELGLQTIHNDTHKRLNTHTTFETFTDAVTRLRQRNLTVIAHVILGLPQESQDMMLQTIQTIGHMDIQGVKLQLLHVLKNTALEKEYQASPFPMFSLEEYCDFVIDCVELLPSHMVIHRLTGDGPRKLLIAPLWSTDKKRVLNTIQKRLKERDTWQGKYFK